MNAIPAVHALARLLAKVGGAKHVSFVSVHKGNASITVGRTAST